MSVKGRWEPYGDGVERMVVRDGEKDYENGNGWLYRVRTDVSGDIVGPGSAAEIEGHVNHELVNVVFVPK